MAIPPVPFLAKTAVSWTGEQEGDLGFLEGEVVRVFHIVDELWWQGSLSRNGAEGIFPKDFVEPLERSTTPSATPTPTKPKPVTTPVKEFRSSKSSPAHEFRSSKSSPAHEFRRSRTSPAHEFRSSKNGYTYKMSPCSKSAPALVNDSFDDDSFSRLKSPQSKRLSQLYSQYVLNLGITPIYKAPTENLTREDEEFALSLSQKKQQLEMELQHLTKLEKMQKAQLVESSFVSEDLVLSKRNFNSRDDLGAKFDNGTYDEDSDCGPPPPPKHKKIPFDADDFRASGASDEKIAVYSEDLKASIKSLQSDVLNLSELSATSAGSFMRHKYERELTKFERELETDMRKMTVEESPMESIFKDKKSRHPKIFQKLMKKKPEQNLMEQRLQENDNDWQTVKVDLNRMNSLTLLDKQARTKRAANEANFIVKPLECVTEINVSETFGDGVSDLQVNERKVAEFLEKYHYSCDFNDVISDISVKFGTWRPNEIRAVLMHLCKFRIIEENERISQAKPKLQEVMHKGEATIFQLNYLFKKLLEALRIPSEVVLGFWKKPNEFYHNEEYVINHCWLSVMVETEPGHGCFRMIDLMCFQNGAICNRDGRNEFYFLAEPLDLVSTHIPSVVELQHVCPPIDLNIAYHLPRVYSGFTKNRLEFVNFNNSLTRMNDLEFFEADLVVPPDVELFTLIKTSRTTSNDYTLCQIRWSRGRRMAKIKAILPEKETIGVLQIFAGAKGLQAHFDNIHELACVIPLYHTGTNRACKFVPRYPTIQSQNNDLYIKHPQLSTISVKNAYNFEVEAHPSMGLNSGSGLMNHDFKLVVESPSGKYTRLVKDEPHKPFGTYRANLFCQEIGLYRALVIGDSGNSWYVFAQWECSGKPSAF